MTAKKTPVLPRLIAGKDNRAAKKIQAAGRKVPKETKERRKVVSTGREKRIPDKEDARSRKGE